MGLFRKKPSAAEVAALKSELSDLRHRLDASEEAKANLEAHVIQLDATTNTLTARSHVIDEVTMRLAEVEVLKRQVAQIDVVNAKITSLDGLNGKLAELNERVVATSDDASQAKEQLASLNERISNVSVELANQLGELSTEMDVLSARQAEPVLAPQQTIATDTIEALTAGQVKLANEQARYEIAFRQDLAMLAEQVKRARS